MAFGKLLGECFFVVCHTPLELLFCNINIFNLNVEILSGRKAIPFFCHFFVGWSNRELLYHLLVSESIYNLRYLIGTEIRLLVLPYFDSFTKLARINKYRLFGLVLIDKNHTDIRTRVSEDITRHTYHTFQNLIVHKVFANFERNATLGCNESGRYNDSSLTRVFQAV